mmetsp:Transcript_6597/g.19597  ORF Transcript_6597/g.19597 Transcript_6597/m.19597 type:complete len:247 (-) Transcript_6597:248-988(-)
MRRTVSAPPRSCELSLRRHRLMWHSYYPHAILVAHLGREVTRHELLHLLHEVLHGNRHPRGRGNMSKSWMCQPSTPCTSSFGHSIVRQVERRAYAVARVSLEKPPDAACPEIALSKAAAVYRVHLGVRVEGAIDSLDINHDQLLARVHEGEVREGMCHGAGAEDVARIVGVLRVGPAKVWLHTTHWNSWPVQKLKDLCHYKTHLRRGRGELVELLRVVFSDHLHPAVRKALFASCAAGRYGGKFCD